MTASLLLAPTFVILMACIHTCVPPEKKVWSQIGLSFAILYAGLLIWNYYLQLTVVRQDPQLYPWLTMNFTPESAFWALETSGYALMGLAALFVAPLFCGGGIRQAIRWLVIINAAAGFAGGIAYVFTGNPLHGLVIASPGIWALAFPATTALLAVAFQRGKLAGASK